MGLFGKKAGTGRNVLEEARERIRRAYLEGDRVAVSFSGGKDSTIVLNLALEVARELGRLPLDVNFIDEEAIAPETEAYVRSVAQRPDVRMLWSCFPVKHRNACSRREPWWHTWDPAIPDRWVRPMPPEAATREEFPNVPEGGIADQIGAFYPASSGTVISLLGRRTGESLTRYRMIARRRGEWAFMMQAGRPEAEHIRTADPIYDFTTADVWTAIHVNGWDYNPAYDVMAAAGISAHLQRLAPPFGEEPMQLLWMWKVCWPETWDRMQARVAGADVAARYSKTSVYAFGDHSLVEPNEGETWEQYIFRLILKFPVEDRSMVARNVADAIDRHLETAPGRPLPDRVPDPDSDMCWHRIAVATYKGMLKARSARGKLFAFRGDRSKRGKTDAEGA